jgi:dienelactone hydrolase
MNTATPIEIPGSGRTLQGFLAEPEAHSGPRAAVIVIHEIFGPDAHIQDVARRLAREGYVAVAPNLFTGEIQKLLTPEAVGEGFRFRSFREFWG